MKIYDIYSPINAKLTSVQNNKAWLCSQRKKNPKIHIISGHYTIKDRLTFLSV